MSKIRSCVYIFSIFAVLKINAADMSFYFLKAPIETWSIEISDYAYQGAHYNYSFTPRILEKKKREALIADRVYAEMREWKEPEKVIADWIYALQMVEQSLLTKPFTTWNIEDIAAISSWLTRLTTENPGVFRDELAVWWTKNLSQAEKEASQLRAFAHFAKTGKHQSSPDFILFTEPSDIVDDLQKTLTAVQIELEAITDRDFEEQQRKAFDIGCKMHFEIVRIHPFKEASKRLGRMLMYIIHAQYGIKSISLDNAAGYIQSLILSLQNDSSTAFINFYKGEIDQLESVARMIAGMGINLAQPIKIEQPKVSQQAKLIAPKFTCAFCKKPGNMRCARCKEVHYCSQDCQQNHWAARHKFNCVKK